MRKNQPFRSNYVIIYYHIHSSMVNAGQGNLDILKLLCITLGTSTILYST